MVYFCFKTSRTFLVSLLGLLGAFCLAGCYPSTSSDNILSSASESCNSINHAAGQTCVPRQPDRIVALDGVSFENLIALGLQPVATTNLQFLEPLLSKQLSGVVDLGDYQSPNLERTLQLEPDLFFGLEEQQGIYDQAAQIAPTVLVPSEHSGEWKEMFAFTAQALGKSSRAEAVMAAYDARMADFKQEMETKASSSDGSKPTISVVRIYPDQITLYTKSGFIGTILEDAGLPRPPSQNLNLEGTQAMGLSAIQYTVSRETFDKADGDVIFIMVGNWDDQIDNVLADLKADPLWSKLSAVQQGAVYEVDDHHWVGTGPIAANAVLDDLFKYLVESPQS